MLRHKGAADLNCRLIFYAARKTAFCERALKKSFSELNLELDGTYFATNSEELGALITSAFACLDMVFVAGGLGISGENGTVSIFSKALSDVSADECKKLKNTFGDDGFVVRSQNQILVLLPDEPQQIEIIMQGPVSGYIREYCGA